MTGHILPLLGDSATEGVKVFIKAADNPLPFSSQKNERVVVPDFCLIRNFPMDIHDNGYVEASSAA